MSRVAPHRNQELQMVLEGKKPLASVERAKDPDQYLEIVNRVSWYNYSPALTFVICGDEIVFTTYENRHLLTLYKLVLEHGVDLFGRELYHRVMGKLYGYSNEDIQAFIDDEIDCDCNKCRGGRYEPETVPSR